MMALFRVGRECALVPQLQVLAIAPLLLSATCINAPRQATDGPQLGGRLSTGTVTSTSSTTLQKLEVAGGPFKQSSPPPVQWELSWGDEFDGDTLNRSLWNVRTNESHCCPAELELYVPEAVSMRGGQLVLRTQNRTLRGPNGQPFAYSSGWIDTQAKWSQKYGRFEANCSLPPRAATGVWPAFWLMPDNQTADPQCWPTGGEIDIFEMNGDPLQDDVFGSYHWARPGQCGKDREPIPGAAWRPAGSAVDWQTGWHVYAVEWRADRLDFFVDGQLYLTRMAGSRGGLLLPTNPMYVIFDQAVDGTLFRPPATPPAAYHGDGVALRVEYVRAYRAKALDDVAR